MPSNNHLNSYECLVTPYRETRAGFIALALEKNKKATPFVEEAKALKAIAHKALNPRDLLNFEQIQSSLLTASGISDKAKNHLKDEDKKEAILGLIDNFLEPAGKDFVDELVYRFLLTRGDSLGGSMRNLGGATGEWKFTRILMSTLSVHGKEFYYLDSKTKKWLLANKDSDLEKKVKGLYWKVKKKERTLIYNLTVPIVRKNVDLCFFDCSPKEIISGKNKHSAHYKAEKYIALGELKGGIDPAGADEHWKTANSALERIRTSFSNKSCQPYTFLLVQLLKKQWRKKYISN